MAASEALKALADLNTALSAAVAAAAKSGLDQCAILAAVQAAATLLEECEEA